MAALALDADPEERPTRGQTSDTQQGFTQLPGPLASRLELWLGAEQGVSPESWRSQAR